MSMKSDIGHIKTYIKQGNPEWPVVDLVDKYFTEQVTWSLEKEEYNKMSTEEKQAFADSLTAPKSTPKQRVAAIVKVAKKQTKVPASKKKVVKPTAKPIETRKSDKVTKMDLAKGVFKKLAGKGRKEVLAALQRDAKLTKAGAKTYYYLLLKKKS